MAVIRINKTQNYTVMSNRHFYERDMSLKAKGLLSLMLSLPDNWEYSIEGLATLSKDGKDGIRSGLKELESFGYMTRKRARNERGILEGTIYTIYEEPQGRETEKPTLEKPTLEKPTLEKPTLENPTLLNTKELNTNILNIKELNTKGDSDFKKIAKLYNDTCVSCRPLKSLTKKRKAAIKKVLSVYSLDDLEKVFQKVQASDYCKGDNPRGWIAGFDWLMDEDNITKLLEGNYDNTSKHKGRKEQVPSWMNKERQQYDYDELEKSLISNGSSTIANNPELQARAEKLKSSLVGG